MPTYAKETQVSSSQSRTEIEKTLQRYGATAFMYGWDHDRAIIAFEYKKKRYRIMLPLPDRSEFNLTEKGRRRTSQQAIDDAYEQATRQRWRALALWIKATLEAAEVGIITLEDALTNFTMLPNGMTVGEWIRPQIDQAYLTGEMPPLLPG